MAAQVDQLDLFLKHFVETVGPVDRHEITSGDEVTGRPRRRLRLKLVT
jgi:hypothetical protein